MRERLKRLIAALLVVAMTVMPGMSVFATVAPTATVTTQSASDTAENDVCYQEASGFLNYLGIMVGDDKGDMKPEETITRAEISAIILRETNVGSKSEYNGIFEDVDASHWAADDIQTAYELGIIAGYGDGTFGPDEDVTYEQAVKMIVCAIGWGPHAELFGEYPQCYIKKASELDLMDNAAGIVGEAVTRRTVAKLVYNSLTAEYPVISGSSNNQLNYVTKEGITILSKKRDIYYQEGMITATSNKSIGTSLSLDDDQIMVEDEIMQSEVQNPDQYVAEYSRVYYRDLDGTGSDKTALYIIPLTKKTKTVTFNAKDIDSIVTGYNGGTPELRYYEENAKSPKKIKLVNQPSISYNNQPFTMANFQALGRDDVTFDEFITPDEGSVKAVDFNKDGKYDVLFVDSYETSVVKTVTPVRLQLEYPILGDTYMLKLDPSEDDSLKLNVIRDEEPCSLKDLQVGDVVSFKTNANFGDTTYTGDKTITIEASIDYVEGTAKNLSSDTASEKYATVDGDKYKILDNDEVFRDVKASMSSKAKFYLNIFGTISYVDSHAMGGLSSGEKYGWLVNVYPDESGDKILVEMYSANDGYQTLQLNSNVDYWDATTGGAVRISDKTIDEYIENTASSGGHILTCNAIGYDEKASIRLCKYKANSSGKITKLYLAVDASTVADDSDAVRIVTKDLKESSQKGGLFDGRYYIDKGVPQLTVPLTLSENRDAENYGYRIADHEDYTTVTGDTGLGYNCFFGDVTDAAPGVIIRMTKSTSEAHDIEDYGTADDNKIIVISEINSGVDENDEEIYIIKGWYNGEEKEYTLAHNVLVAQVNEDPWAGNNRSYAATTLWTNKDSRSLTEVLHIGDICGIDGSNSEVGIVLRMVDTEGMADYFANGEAGDGAPSAQFFRDEMFSSSRDRIIFGKVARTLSSPIVQIGFKNRGSYDGNDIQDDEDEDVTISVALADVTRVVQFIYISSNGKITVDQDESDAYEIQRGDYVFMRNYRNDAARELYVIRYEG
ncbi:MAG: S-layer homology domain-containing protein [Clostridia bacterium]